MTRSVWLILIAVALAGCETSTAGDNPDGPDAVTTGCLTAASATFERPFEVDPEQYPFDDCAFETAAGTMHYVDAGPKDALHTVLMVHGNPESAGPRRGARPAEPHDRGARLGRADRA